MTQTTVATVDRGGIEIFVPGVGQYDNIGDIILRRQLVAWLQPLGRLHIYVGDSPDGYAESLGVAPDDIVYRSFARWYRAAAAEAWSGRARYVFKPGEIQLTVLGMKEHLSVLPLLAVIRARGGAVARVGAGSRNFAPFPRLLMQPSLALSDLRVWRDGDTAEYLGGDVMPDLAFGEGDGSGGALPADERGTVVVSMRSDRPEPGEAWFAGIRRFAQHDGKRIVVVTQVLRDRDRSRSLAARLDADLIDWDGSDHGGQEDRLREAYGQAALAVSDRLHVLIAAVTEGAVPIALLTDDSRKIDRHFAAAGLPGIGVPSAALTAEEIAEELETAAARGAESRAAVANARVELSEVRDRLASVMTGAPARTPALVPG